MNVEQLISSYGYAAILVGTFFEGESVLVIAGFLSHLGYLRLPFVILTAFLGTLIGDQLYFYLGRIKGKSFIEKRPKWRQKSEKVFRLLDRHSTLLILGFRFLYGIRTVTPFILGSSGISPVKYLILNVAGAFVWATVIGTLSFFFGHTLELFLGEVKLYEKWILLALVLASLVIWGIYYFANSKRNR